MKPGVLEGSFNEPGVAQEFYPVKSGLALKIHLIEFGFILESCLIKLGIFKHGMVGRVARRAIEDCLQERARDRYAPGINPSGLSNLLKRSIPLRVPRIRQALVTSIETYTNASIFITRQPVNIYPISHCSTSQTPTSHH